jgi:hypothetical protein
MTASVKLMIQELASVVEAAGESGSIRVAMGTDVGAGVLAIKVRQQCLLGVLPYLCCELKGCWNSKLMKH